MFTVPRNLNDKIKAHSKLNMETSNEIKKSYLDASVHIERQEIPEGSIVQVKFQFTPGYGANDPREEVSGGNSVNRIACESRT